MSSPTTLTAANPVLPEFDQEAMDRRFVAEVHRLFEVGAFASFREFTTTLDVQPSLLSQVEAGRYHCNQRMLYNMKRHYPVSDVDWVLFGSALTGRPEPVHLLQRQRGRPVEKLASKTKPA